MPFQIVRNDITKMKVDAIVNAANSSLLGGGGVDGSIHRAAGPKLLEACQALHGCETGSAKITKGYRLPAKYVIHAVGPRWRGGTHGEEQQLASCYRVSLALAKEYHCASIAFPLISSGIYGYPKDQALRVATDEISRFLMKNEMLVYLVVFDRRSFQISSQLYANIQAYVDDRYAEDHTDSRWKQKSRLKEMGLWEDETFGVEPDDAAPYAIKETPLAPSAAKQSAQSLEDALGQIDESFSEMLLRKIDASGMTDAECYKKANIDRKLFSKIRSNKNYRPSKNTVLAFAIALRLPINETKDMLMKAGFALSHSSKADIIVEYFLEQGNYNIYEINEALFAFDQPLIGG